MSVSIFKSGFVVEGQIRRIKGISPSGSHHGSVTSTHTSTSSHWYLSHATNTITATTKVLGFRFRPFGELGNLVIALALA